MYFIRAHRITNFSLTAWLSIERRMVTAQDLVCTGQVIVFSIWTGSLDLVGAALDDEDVPFCRRAPSSQGCSSLLEHSQHLHASSLQCCMPSQQVQGALLGCAGASGARVSHIAAQAGWTAP